MLVLAHSVNYHYNLTRYSNQFALKKRALVFLKINLDATTLLVLYLNKLQASGTEE